MKNKGFTLIELSGVFVLLALILVITIPQIINSVKKGSDQKYEQFLDTIYIASENYIAEYNLNIGNQDNYIIITLEKLMKSGFLKSSLVNPNTNEKIADNSNIGAIKVYKNSDNKYVYEFLKDYNSEITGLEKKSYKVGEEIKYADKNWYVVSDDTDSVTIILKNSIGSGRYGNNTNFANSDAKNALEKWFKADEYLYSAYLNNEVITDSNGYYVKLITKDKLPTGYSKTTDNPFWTMTSEGAQIVIAFASGETSYMPFNDLEYIVTFSGFTRFTGEGNYSPGNGHYVSKSGAQKQTFLNLPSSDKIESLRYGSFVSSFYAATSSSTVTRNNNFQYCNFTTGISEYLICYVDKCTFSTASTCKKRYKYEIVNWSQKPIDYVPVITVKKK